ncbi:hypothetical protein [Pseudomonas sp. dw_358]|uniref:hypothetical protein n=1 Tax=Pseudomonas sp. dw_358 TaxID=2720083 RepID=UPI001BD386DA|nr:hypothetical protein [Pseudomonas sp. dw_358]
MRTKDKQESIAMRFDFIDHVEGRDHFNISAASGEYMGAKLGISRNGYLGFYSIAEVTDFWKLQWVGSSDSGQCIWRDHRGHRVSVITRVDPPANIRQPQTPQNILNRTFDYLSAEEGQVLDFQVRILSVG